MILVFVVFTANLKAQVNNIQASDSTSLELYNRGDWKQLIKYRDQTLNTGRADFPGLRLRIGYAFMMTGNYKQALKQFENILSKDTYNQTVRYYAYLCNKYLNNDLSASYNAAYLQNKNGLSSFGLIDAGAESSVKINTDINRDNATYSRISLSNRLSWRWQLEESLAYYNQTIFKLGNYDGYGNSVHAADQQKEYYAKLSFAISNQLTLMGAYHYANTKFETTTDNSNLGLLALRYNGTYVDLQGDINFGRLDDKQLQQYDAKLTFYPFGNFNLYTISRGSDQHLNSNDHFIFNQAIGFKVIKNTWLESTITIGDQDDYLDADGLYIYNAIDKTTFKYGETLFYQLGAHSQLQLSYVYEKKDDTYQSLNYVQNSVTLGFLWKF